MMWADMQILTFSGNSVKIYSILDSVLQNHIYLYEVEEITTYNSSPK